jgi:methyl-accepting chemotaxis protein
MNEKLLANKKPLLSLDRTVILAGLVLLVIHYGFVQISPFLVFENNVLPVWPSTGLFLAAVLGLGYRVAPAVFVADLMVQYFTYNSLLATSMIAVLDLWDVLVTAFLIQRLIPYTALFGRAQDVFKYVLSLLVSPLLSSTLSGIGLCAMGYAVWENYWPAWWSWYAGIVLGELVLTPALLSWSGRVDSAHLLSRQAIPEFVLVCGLVVAIGIATFAGDYPLEFLILPVLFWSALRFGQRETMPLVLGMSAIAVWQTAQEAGPFIRPSNSESLVLLQAFMGVMALSILVVSAVISQNRRTEGELKQTNRSLRNALHELQHTQEVLEERNRELEWQVDSRTAELYESRAAAAAARTALQSRAIELLQEISPVQQGDLTVQLQVTPDEIGTLADSYNTIISSLRAIIVQVQTAAEQMVESARTNESSVQGLYGEAARQAEEIEQVLQQIEQLEAIVQQVALKTRQAESVMQQAERVVQEGDAVMNQTVQEIQAVQATVVRTANKVRQLDESSGKISTIVNLINEFAAQTHMLALNTSIEASRAGEHGKGFRVIATEVQELATQSAKAARDIQVLITNIQEETKEVVAAMEAGQQQVVTGTRLVSQTRQSLNEVTAVSQQISELVESIAQDTVMQSQMSGQVTEVMKDVAAIANKTSDEASDVALSFQELRQVAYRLRNYVEQFKLS